MITQFIAPYLHSEGIADFTPSGNLFVGFMPDSPDNCIALYEETGIVEGYQQAYGSDWMGFMVRLRGSQVWAQDKIWEIHRKTIGLTEQGFEKFYLKVVQVQTMPEQVEIDEKGRPVFTSHYMALVNTFDNSYRFSVTEPITQS